MTELQSPMEPNDSSIETEYTDSTDAANPDNSANTGANNENGAFEIAANQHETLSDLTDLLNEPNVSPTTITNNLHWYLLAGGNLEKLREQNQSNGPLVKAIDVVLQHKSEAPAAKEELKAAISSSDETSLEQLAQLMSDYLDKYQFFEAQNHGMSELIAETTATETQRVLANQAFDSAVKRKTDAFQHRFSAALRDISNRDSNIGDENKNLLNSASSSLDSAVSDLSSDNMQKITGQDNETTASEWLDELQKKYEQPENKQRRWGLLKALGIEQAKTPSEKRAIFAIAAVGFCMLLADAGMARVSGQRSILDGINDVLSGLDREFERAKTYRELKLVNPEKAARYQKQLQPNVLFTWLLKFFENGNNNNNSSTAST